MTRETEKKAKEKLKNAERRQCKISNSRNIRLMITIIRVNTINFEQIGEQPNNYTKDLFSTPNLLQNHS